MDPVKIGVLSLGWTGVFMIIGAVVTGETAMPSETNVILSIIFLTVFCTAISFVIQPVAQRHTEPAHIGLIFSLEPVFAGVTSIVLEHTYPMGRELFGKALMIIALVLLELSSGTEGADVKS